MCVCVCVCVVQVLLEGPYGAVGLDLDSGRYKVLLLLGGGIGVTPMQSVCEQSFPRATTS